MTRWQGVVAAVALATFSPNAAAPPAKSTPVLSHVAEGEIRILRSPGLPERQVRVLRLPRPGERTVLAEVQDLATGASYTVPVRILAASECLSLPNHHQTDSQIVSSPTVTQAVPPAAQSPSNPPPVSERPGFFQKLFGPKTAPASTSQSKSPPRSVTGLPKTAQTPMAVASPPPPTPLREAEAPIPAVRPLGTRETGVMPAGASDLPPGVSLPPVMSLPPPTTPSAQPAIVPPTALITPEVAPAVPPILPALPRPGPPPNVTIPNAEAPSPLPKMTVTATSPPLTDLPSSLELPKLIVVPVPEPDQPSPAGGDSTRPSLSSLSPSSVPASAAPVEHRLTSASGPDRSHATELEWTLDEMTRLVTELHTGPRPSIRELAAHSLVDSGYSNRPAVQSALARAAMTDEAPSVRATCIRLLSGTSYRDVAYRDYLKTCEESSVPELRAAATAALTRLAVGR